MASGFSNSFWSADYAAGLGVLFDKLQQGVQENQQIMTIAKMRSEAEDSYGQRLADIVPATDRISGGFQRDDGASTRKAYEGIRGEMNDASSNHKKIASNIRELVLNPFGKWCEEHAQRIQTAQDELQSRIKAHDRQAEVVKKLRNTYYNKFRLVEDLEEEDKLAFQDPKAQSPQSPKGKERAVPVINEPGSEPPKEPSKESGKDSEDEIEPVELGDRMYSPESLKKILAHMLETIKLGEVKVAFLGTYQNVSTGAEITEYIQKNMPVTNLAAAEKVGQDLIDNGFLRQVGTVGNNFANSSKMNYQWKSKAFQLAGVPEKKKPMDRVASLGLNMDPDSPVGAMTDMISGWNPLNNPYPNETGPQRLRREAREADERYKGAVRKLDALRCNLEEAMMVHLNWMERCELDRLKAIKAVVLDFSGAIGNVIPSLRSTVDKMMLFQETIQPQNDLRYLLENYRTGSFVPRVQLYENYYNNKDDQTFGVDLEDRARIDNKRVPTVVSGLLTYLDNHYPDLDGDEARRSIWLVDVPLTHTHQLRALINNGKPVGFDILEKFPIPVVASVFKLYLLELPDPVVSSQVYEVIKTIYSSSATDGNEEARVQVIQNTLGQLRLANIATLDAITTHFTRLIELTSADEDYISRLATILAPCILRPKLENTLTMNEKYNYRLVRDLFAQKDKIFGELKRQSSLKQRENNGNNPATPSAAAARRARGLSTDERSRRDMEQERHHAVVEAARSRGVSPAGTSRIRRERSPHRMSGGADTRFPVAVHRQSLEVPGAAGATASEKTNGGAHAAPATTTVPAAVPSVTGPTSEHAATPAATSSVPSAREETPMMSATGGPYQDFPVGGGEE